MNTDTIDLNQSNQILQIINYIFIIEKNILIF
jgi:hypothetical protein